MSSIYSKSVNLFTILILILGCFTSDLLATNSIDHSITDTVYLNGNGAVNVDVSSYLTAFQDYNSSITALENVTETTFDCEISTGFVQVLLFNGSDTLSGGIHLTVLDTISPLLYIHNSTTLYLNENGVVDDVWETVNNNSKDNCSFGVTLNPSVFNCETLGLQQVIVTLTDESGNTATDSVFVTIVDNSSPTIILNPVVAYLDAFGQATISISDLDGGSYDNCDNNFTLTLSDSIFTYADIGVNSVLFSLSNSHGETVSLNAPIEVRDTLPPSINSQNLVLYLDNNGELVVTAGMFNNGTTDNSLIYTLEINDAFFTCNDLGLNILELTATDNYNNSSLVEVELEVKDHIDPVAITEDIVLVLNETGQAILNPDDFDNGSYDNCSITKTVSESNFDCDDIGSHAVFLNVTDGSGNFNTAMGNVTIVDNTAPVAVTQSYSLELDQDGLAMVMAQDIDNGSYDNCSGIDNYTISNSQFDCTNLGSNTVVFGVSDVYGNTSTVQSTIHILDELSPVIAVQDITADLDSNGHYFLNEDDINIGTVDNCSDDLIYTYSDSVLTALDLGVNTITVYVTDESGNVASDEIVVTVEDHITPKLNLSIPDQLGYSESNFCGAFVFFPTPGFEDNSGEFTVSYSHVSGSFFGLGNSTVYYTATDGSGNSTLDSFVVAILDITPPVVINTITNYTYDESGVVVWDTNQMVFSDNCSSDLMVSLSHHSLDTFIIGTTVVTGTVTDAFNNVSTFTFDIVVEDLENPEFISVPDDIQIYLTESDGCDILVEYPEALASDNHSSTVISYTIPSGSVLEVGDHLVEVSAIDDAGNNTIQNFNISILDTIAPVFTSVPETIYAGLCDNNVLYQTPDVEDNCTISALYRTSGLASGSIFPVGVHQIVYLAVDVHGNSTEISFEVNIQQIEPPYVPSVRIGCTGLEPFDLVDDSDDIQFFGEGVESKQFNPALVESGVYTVTWRWEDSFGCETNSTMEVIINDTPPTPEVIQPDMFQLSVHNAYNTYQWYKNGELIEGATYKDLEIYDGGNYEVIVENESGCTALSQVYNIGGGVFASLDIDEFQSTGIVVSPNPASNYIIVTTKELITESTVVLYNMLGQKFQVSQIEVLNNYQIQLEISHLSEGLYECTIETALGIVSKKVMVN